MGRTHDVIISGFDLDRLEAELDEMTLRWERTNDALFAERALADRLADCLNNLWHHHSLTEASYDYIDNALTAWKEARHD